MAVYRVGCGAVRGVWSCKRFRATHRAGRSWMQLAVDGRNSWFCCAFAFIGSARRLDRSPCHTPPLQLPPLSVRRALERHTHDASAGMMCGGWCSVRFKRVRRRCSRALTRPRGQLVFQRDDRRHSHLHQNERHKPGRGSESHVSQEHACRRNHSQRIRQRRGRARGTAASS